MGPPSMNGGRLMAIRSFLDGFLGFNGAAVDERRKGSSRITSTPENAASMGPPSMNGGRPIPTHEGGEGSGASMGPPSMNGGRLAPDNSRPSFARASMGPPSMNGGRLQRAKQSGNGSGLQWGRRR